MRILVVANLTLCGPHLLEELDERMTRGSCEFHVLVPASHSTLDGGWTWTEREASAEAEERLMAMLGTLEKRGVRATGQVGDIRAIDATLDALRDADYDEIIISTLPPNASRWLRLDLVSRLERAVDVPVTHVVAEPAQV
jgi:hypothetical protein